MDLRMNRVQLYVGHLPLYTQHFRISYILKLSINTPFTFKRLSHFTFVWNIMVTVVWRDASMDSLGTCVFMGCLILCAGYQILTILLYDMLITLEWFSHILWLMQTIETRTSPSTHSTLTILVDERFLACIHYAHRDHLSMQSITLLLIKLISLDTW